MSPDAAPDQAVTGSATVAVVGGRGYVGRELIALTSRHPRLTLATASSSSLAGQSIREVADAAPDLRFEDLTPAALASDPPDVVFLCLKNGASQEWVDALEAAAAPPRLIVDITADHRFDDGWTYGLPELNREAIRTARRIANPGCYATAMALCAAPLTERLASPAHCFGVSGYSGAGATPNERNDPDRLRDSVLPYALSGHIHEREVARHTGVAMRFAPSVAPFFRGIVLTTLAEVTSPTCGEEVQALFQAQYGGAACVEVVGGDPPRLAAVVGTPRAVVGGLCAHGDDPRRVAAVCVLDNLLKGAASQAIQNVNLALGYEETEGLLG